MTLSSLFWVESVSKLTGSLSWYWGLRCDCGWISLAWLHNRVCLDGWEGGPVVFSYWGWAAWIWTARVLVERLWRFQGFFGGGLLIVGGIAGGGERRLLCYGEGGSGGGLRIGWNGGSAFSALLFPKTLCYMFSALLLYLLNGELTWSSYFGIRCRRG